MCKTVCSTFNIIGTLSFLKDFPISFNGQHSQIKYAKLGIVSLQLKLLP